MNKVFIFNVLLNKIYIKEVHYMSKELCISIVVALLDFAVLMYLSLTNIIIFIIVVHTLLAILIVLIPRFI
ncbi:MULTISPECIES: hypothetical protein [Clostridium]|uniref:hypothetical protein n=1 Tax=Clostridium botulinum TaxID=1491 RepID=UPI0013D8B180|nr:hypothetical protein [Clostridium botulinum]MBD5592961.1 hypothetical protein [Clostridium botulinum]MBD5631352.1 hypothetical protein [Clostridium botulinum]MCR1075110.1 hypothetical protein [Clostridium botulinum]